jgi:DNA replication protein DnaC
MVLSPYKADPAEMREIRLSLRRDPAEIGPRFPKEYRHRRLADVDPSVYRDDAWTTVSGYANELRKHRSDGTGLALFGPPGQGKSLIAAIMLNEALETLYAWVRFETLPGLLDLHGARIRAERRSEGHHEGAWEEAERLDGLIRRIHGEGVGNKPPFDFLVLDDVGKEHRTDSGYQAAKFDEVLRHRYSAGLPTIVTSNLPLAKWADTYGAATRSFIYQACLTVPMDTGQDYRMRGRRRAGG